MLAAAAASVTLDPESMVDVAGVTVPDPATLAMPWTVTGIALNVTKHAFAPSSDANVIAFTCPAPLLTIPSHAPPPLAAQLTRSSVAGVAVSTTLVPDRNSPLQDPPVALQPLIPFGSLATVPLAPVTVTPTLYCR